MGASGRRAAGCQRGWRAGVDGRPAHVRPGRAGPDGAAGRGGRRVGADRGADGGVVRLVGPDLRVRRKPPAPRSPLVLVQLPDLAAAGLVRREGAFTRRTGRIVLQRPADRAEAGWAGRAVVAAFAGERRGDWRRVRTGVYVVRAEWDAALASEGGYYSSTGPAGFSPVSRAL